MKSVLIAYPVGSTSQLLARDLVGNSFSVDFYRLDNCCNEFFKEFERDIASYEDITSCTPKSQMISSKDWKKYDMIIFPGLNIQPEEPAHIYWTVCESLFGGLRDVLLNPNVQFLFGQNTSGLVAATHLGRVMPEYRKQIYVFSSIYESAEKILGEGSTDTFPEAFPMDKGDIFLHRKDDGGSDESKIGHLRGVWKFGQFAMMEATALYNAAIALDQKELDSTFKMLGRFMEGSEAEGYSTAIWHCESVGEDSELQAKLHALEKWIRKVPE